MRRLDPRLHVGLLIIASACLVSACVGGEQPASDTSVKARQIRAQGRAAARAGAAEQAAALADGRVTESELRQAYSDAAECMRVAGLPVAGIEEFEAVFGPAFEFADGPGRRSPADNLRISTECERTWDGFVAQAYVIQHGFRFTPKARVAVERCLRGKGVDIEARSADEAIIKTPEAEDAVACMIEAQGGHVLGLGLSDEAAEKTAHL